MAATNKIGHGTGTQATDACELVAIAELADMLRQLGAESSQSTDTPIDVAPYLDGLQAVAQRIHRMKPLDADGRDLAARHYYAGVFAGACGEDSAIACGVSGSLARRAGQVSGAALRCFTRLARIGRRHGRAFVAGRADGVQASHPLARRA
ncbi:hypothetical protein [Burkholderia sp. SIMBA_062]|uniref:hypothetical protein n=1 Tax=Burkholderia sp. SIMBA_062 TaxID=3085803 RepID=UPI00397B21BA